MSLPFFFGGGSGAGAGAGAGGGSGGGGGGGAPTSATIGSGASAVGTATSGSFGPNTCTVVGGVAPLTYAWEVTASYGATWNTGAAETFTPSWSGLTPGNIASATYACKVIDADGNTITSNLATYTYRNNGTTPGSGRDLP